jgi:Protein of unknown function (DUF1573)
MPRLLPWRLVAALVGVLLLAAAALKTYGAFRGLVSPLGAFASPWVQFALVQAECLLGVWLLSGWYPRGAWAATMLTFAGFAAISAYQGRIGQASCGCFGALSVKPWYTFGLDLFVLAVLGFARPRQQTLMSGHEPPALPSFARNAIPVVITTAVLLVALTTTATVRYGSPAAALAQLRGERLSVSPSVVDFGDAPGGETREAAIDLTNRTEHPLRVVGGTSDCACTVLQDLPVTVAPGETRSVTVRVRIPAASGQFTHPVHLLAGDEQLWTVGFHATGRSSGIAEAQAAQR